ncbi:MAG: hypothetical protein ABIO79_07425 [Ferruginibacter sp.]
MKILFTCILFFLSSFSFGQYAIIQDKVGYSNVRSSADAEAKVKDSLNNGHLVYCFEKKGNWIDVNYKKNKVETKGFVYYDRLKLISEYDNIPHLKKGVSHVVLGKDSITVTVTQQSFNRALYKLTYLKGSKTQIEFINGKDFWGTDGELPHVEYRSIVIAIGKRKIVLPKAALNNLFEPRLSGTAVNYDKVNDVIYIQSSNSDGAGFYTVIWKIENGIYKDRYIVYGF